MTLGNEKVAGPPFWATDFAVPSADTLRSSMEEFQDLAMRFAASVLLPGTT